MRIQKKSVRNLERNLPGISSGTELIFVVPLSEIPVERLERIGFSSAPKLGDTILPAKIGPKSRFNAEGSFTRHRDRPKETCFRQREWSYKQWCGNDTEEVTKIVDVPYPRYQRTPIPPPSRELKISILPDESL